MSVDWTIQRVEGESTTDLGVLPSFLSVAEVEVALQRLLCTRLSEQEVLSASLRHGMGGHSSLLERVGAPIGTTITFGQGEVRFVATRMTDKAQEA